jgi:putative sterol carrier protein
MRFLTEEDAATGVSRAAWGFLAVQAMIAPGRLPAGLEEAYQFVVDGEVFHVSVANGTATSARGPAAAPALVITTDAETFIRVGAGLITPFDAALVGRIRAEGDAEAIQRCALLLGLAEPASTAAAV